MAKSGVKNALIAAILEKLSQVLKATSSSAEAAHQAATGEDSKAENQYDTRGLEASYLAGAQMKRVEELQRQILFFQTLQGAAEEPVSDRVKIGSLVETEQRPRRQAFYLMVPEDGGGAVEVEGKTVNVITPQSPLGEVLMGSFVGDEVEFENNGAVRLVVVRGIE